MERLKGTSYRLQILVLAFVVLTPCVVVLEAASGSWEQLLNMPPNIPLDPSRIFGGALFAVMVVAMIKPAAYMVAFWRLYKLLGLYRNGVIFTAANVAAIRRIGWALVSVDVAAMIQTAVRGPVLTYFEISQGHISVGIEAAFLTIGLFVVLIAHVMDLGRELKEQDSLVI